MSTSFETVDEKIAEAEFFLRQMCCSPDQEFRWHFSAFLSATRTSTLALQRFNHLPGFSEWYEPHRQRLATSLLAKQFLLMRNDHAHGGDYPLGGSMSAGNGTKHFFPRKSYKDTHPLDPKDVVSASREYFVLLLELVYDCYVKLGVHIDPQQYFTKEHYGRDIDAAECEVHGWVCTSLIEEGLSKSDRWHELRGHVGECTINHLFYGYLEKVTPQPKMPAHYRDFEDSYEDRGWLHVPAGFTSIEAYRQFVKAAKAAARAAGKKAKV